MYVINAKNVNDALSQGIKLMMTMGKGLGSRVGDTMEVPFPVSTVYHHPQQRVLISKARDANPFFHLMEALWILAGREDVKFLIEFNKRMVDYSDDGLTFNAPYGFRLRNGVNSVSDQLDKVIAVLNDDPYTRQAVCQIWDDVDLGKMTKDKACNMSIVFRVRDSKLCMTVYNRSNDMIWGAYGANAVQFSMIQEYVAAHLGMEMGTYTQVSNSYHVYTSGVAGDLWFKLSKEYDITAAPYDQVDQMVMMHHDDMKMFDQDLRLFFSIYDDYNIDEILNCDSWKSEYFNDLVIPMLGVYREHKIYGPNNALDLTRFIKADDWCMAAEDWLEKRVK